ncbi:hypothetical protein GCM10007320_30940 [Pseudorhodoferax aquiterrae]|uniref:TIGR02281 family clan AA aspartic protease n=1 Tax=Pseudorhodoferax aquiterrae TaxID=747304 RepID=A0ABQ3G2M5_9BURK|nr:retropepsin-like aspartic protease [Pseudorhodoferax aquiterrae]GHC85702.1 hypothetical protein GCM10007320_30940 [Pseudorhodoferax aquiterrae]
MNTQRGMVLRGALAMVAFWLAVMALLYWAMDRWQQPRAARVTATGELLIPRHADGHFRIPGTINGEPVLFLVDTGASVVGVSEALARRAGLQGGEPASFHTANGVREGRMVRAGRIELQGGASVRDLRVGVGLALGDDDAQALLGQNFLQHFEVRMDRDSMRLRPRDP